MAGLVDGQAVGAAGGFVFPDRSGLAVPAGHRVVALQGESGRALVIRDHRRVPATSPRWGLGFNDSAAGRIGFADGAVACGPYHAVSVFIHP